MFTLEHLFVVAGFTLGMAVALRLLRERQRPSVTFAWLAAMVLWPYVGVPLFLIFYPRKLHMKRRRRVDAKRRLYERRAFGTAPELGGIELLLHALGIPAAREGNRVELVLDATEAWDRTLAAIADAEEEILCAMFLIADDAVGRAFVAALAKKARDGVRVRLLVDALGCFGRKGRFLDPLRDAGGAVGIFLPVVPVSRRWSANLRNHRKLLLVDRAVALTGGRNIGDEYLGPPSERQRWIDTTVVVHGPVLGDLLNVFCKDWEFATNERLSTDSAGDAPPPAGEARAQVVVSGPDVPDDSLSDAVFAAIAEARERTWVITPYYVPDEALQRALKLQARMGRDVLLVLPERSNHRFADLARERFLDELVATGARVRLVPERMVHAKAMLFDDFLAVVGSANLDQRSLYLNFESSLFLTSDRELLQAAHWIDTLARMGHDHVPKRPGWLGRWAQDLALLVSPLL